ncbi:MAG TPA: adenylosuccinate lyase family protein [Candidatus Dormibacteraeota bacterium]|nr:adenylosuccinate lyase family protein [Candidatus Dormibacteraeota bacterium]
MGARLSDSRLYAHLWGTDELRAVFDEEARLQSWLDILAMLAAAQAELGIIPAASAEAIAAAAAVDRLDLDLAAEVTRRTSHSTLGLIAALQRLLPPEAAEHVYYGATVQDLTDTWTALAIRRTGQVVWRDLGAVEELLLDLAERHRDTLMPGRTHGQPGSPVSFGLKAASWADEVRRHRERLGEGAPRWLAGQLGGAVGTLAFFGDRGLELRARFCERLGLRDPVVPWLTARDRIAEFGHLLAMVTATLARIGTEVYQLQRPEIGELREPTTAAAVGSITMPHKRNPEASEHLVTLARLVRQQAATLLEGMVGEHERDGRAWKAEWIALPETCLLTGAALALARRLLDGLEVDADRMRRNLEAHGGYAASEAVLAELAPRLGKHRAQGLLQEALRAGQERGQSLEEALRDPLAGVDGGVHVAAGAGSAGAIVDTAVRRGRTALAAEPDPWR